MRPRAVVRLALLAAIALSAAAPLAAQEPAGPMFRSSPAPPSTPPAAPPAAAPAPPEPGAQAVPPSPPTPEAGPAPRIALSMEEVRQIAALRDLARGNDPAAAAKATEAYLQDFPGGAYRDEALLALGDARSAQGQPQPALEAYQRLIDEFPESPFREYALAQSFAALRQSGRRDEAERRLKALEEQYPRGLTRERAKFWRARERAEADDPVGLIAELSEVDREQLPTDRDKAEYDRLMGVALFRSGQRERAEPYLARYLQAEDSAEHKASVLMMLGDEARQARRFSQALEQYQRIVARYPHPPLLPEAQYWRAEMFVRARLDPAPPEKKAEARNQAIVNYSAYLDGADDAFRARALQRRAELLAEAGRHEEALKDHDRLFALDSAYRNEPSVITARAALLVKLGREQEAVALLNQAGENPAIAPGARSGILIEQARMHYEGKNCADVFRLLRPLPAFESSEQVNQAVFMRGFCYYRLGQWEEASADLEVLARYPRHLPTVWEPLVDAYERSGQYSRMVRFLEEQIAAKRIEPTAKTYDQLANGYERLNQPALVIAAYRRLELADPQALQTPVAQARLGKAEEATGRPDRAVTHYEAALAAKGPEEPPGEAYRDALERLRGLLTRTGQFERLVRQIEAAQPALAAPEDQATLRNAKRETFLAWGKADAEAGRNGEAAAHLQAAWELTAEDDSPRRLDTLALLAAAFRGNGEADKAVAAYQAELERSEDGLYRVQLSTALAAFYQEWAQSVEKESGVAEALPLYESALVYLPGQQWERRYRIVQRLDPVYQEQKRFGELIGHLESMEPAVTDRQFRAELRRYRIELYRLWGRSLADEGKPGEAARQLGNAITLMLGQGNWAGLSDLASARGEALREDPAFEAQVHQLRQAEAAAPDAAARNEARLAVVATRVQWGAFRESQEDPEGALAQYSAARERLTEADWSWRRDVTVRMADVHQKRGDPARQSAVLEALLPQAPPGAEQAALRQKLVEADLLWARALDKEQKADQALERYRKALALTERAQWRLRYPIVQEMGNLMLRENDTRNLAALYEGFRPDVDDPALKPRIDLFLGQLYAKWADDTFRAKKYEHARQRYHKALEVLPPEQWELRVNVAKQLEAIYDQEDQRDAVTALYKALVPTLPEGEVRRKHALYLGRLLWDKAQRDDQALPWLRAADAGGNDAVSVEAAFVQTEIALAKKRTAQARGALEKLAQRDLNGSGWYVPIHYQLAVLYHQDDRLQDALSQYKLVAGQDSPEARKLYPKALAQSREQVAKLEAYLRIRGGDAGARIESPGFVRKPPTPGPKER